VGRQTQVRQDWSARPPQVLKPCSRHLTPCVSLDAVPADQRGRSGQRQHGVYLRDGEHLAGRRPIVGQQLFSKPVMIRASSHSELPHGWAVQ
jgi:hypothetical protein